MEGGLQRLCAVKLVRDGEVYRWKTLPPLPSGFAEVVMLLMAERRDGKWAEVEELEKFRHCPLSSLPLKRLRVRTSPAVLSLLQLSRLRSLEAERLTIQEINSIAARTGDSLRSLELAKCERLDFHNVQRLVGISFFSNLTSLSLSGCQNIDDKALWLIAERCAKSLQKIDLSFTAVNEASALSLFTRLRSLSLAATELSPKLLDVFQPLGHSLESLDLSGTSIFCGNVFDDRDAVVMFSFLHGLQELNLSIMDLRAFFFDAFFSSLPSKLKTLRLSGCAGVDRKFLGRLVRFIPSLESLDLSYIKRDWSDSIRSFKSLKKLDLSHSCGLLGNCFEDRNVNLQLRELCLAHCQVDKTSLLALLENLGHSMDYLDLSGNEVDDEVLQLLSEKFCLPAKIERLNISDSARITLDGAKAILACWRAPYANLTLPVEIIGKLSQTYRSLGILRKNSSIAKGGSFESRKPEKSKFYDPTEPRRKIEPRRIYSAQALLIVRGSPLVNELSRKFGDKLRALCDPVVAQCISRPVIC
eukprot:Plantae.Rhodophyta-Purpureofilum_apyrenoidigerum.ctg13064.p1 GENE.Plantae.Rhodophyta-Purpureofilum_apyrenoidigerum.ctg13064~~Plantae.Rhodophyta-Purpureofilum_apyrenoidigerum.ctg13064.p1  ORF type:complete len:529 (+),score=70.48 Plantae.Rhodophyta-Purpureofilum_apyrenoidigerum.ctg13064:864-2450(+)